MADVDVPQVVGLALVELAAVAPVRTCEAARRWVRSAKVPRLLGPACWSSE
jgi:hypothetical protein